MKHKSVKLTESTRILLNKGKSQLLLKNPALKKLTDEMVINQALKKLLKVTK